MNLCKTLISILFLITPFDSLEFPIDSVQIFETYNSNIEKSKKEIYEYINYLQKTNFEEKQKIGDIIFDLYKFEVEKKTLYNSDDKIIFEQIEIIFSENLNLVLENKNFDFFFEKLKSLILSSILNQHTTLNEEKSNYYQNLIKKNMEKKDLSYEDSVKDINKNVDYINYQNEFQQRLNQPKIFAFLVLKFKKLFGKLKIDRNTQIQNFNINFEIPTKILSDYKNSVIAFKNLKKDPISNLIEIIKNIVDNIENEDFIVDNSNFDILKKKFYDFNLALVILLKKKKNPDFSENLLEVIFYLSKRNFMNKKKNDLKILIVQDILNILIENNETVKAFEFINNFIFKKEKKNKFGEIIKSKIKQNFDIRNLKDKIMILTIIGESETLTFLDENEKTNILKNYLILVKLDNSLYENNIDNIIYENLIYLIPENKENIYEIFYDVILDFKITKYNLNFTDEEILSDFDKFIDRQNGNENSYLILKLVLVNFFKGKKNITQKFDVDKTKNGTLVNFFLPDNNNLVNVIYSLCFNKNYGIKKNFDLEYYLIFLKGKIFNMEEIDFDNTTIFNTNEDEEETLVVNKTKKINEGVQNLNIKKFPKKIDAEKKMYIKADKIHFANPNEKIKIDEQINIKKNNGDNLVNYLYGEIDEKVINVLKKRTDFENFKTEFVTYEEGEDYVKQKMYVYIKRKSSPCFDKQK